MWNGFPRRSNQGCGWWAEAHDLGYLGLSFWYELAFFCLIRWNTLRKDRWFVSWRKHLSPSNIVVCPSVCFSTANIRTKINLGKVFVFVFCFVLLTFADESVTEESQGSSTGMNWSRGHGGLPLTGLLPLACSVFFFYTTQNYLSWSCTIHSEQSHSLSITNQGKCPADSTQVKQMGAIPQRGSGSSYPSTLVKPTKLTSILPVLGHSAGAQNICILLKRLLLVNEKYFLLLLLFSKFLDT